MAAPICCGKVDRECRSLTSTGVMVRHLAADYLRSSAKPDSGWECQPLGQDGGEVIASSIFERGLYWGLYTLLLHLWYAVRKARLTGGSLPSRRTTGGTVSLSLKVASGHCQRVDSLRSIASRTDCVDAIQHGVTTPTHGSWSKSTKVKQCPTGPALDSPTSCRPSTWTATCAALTPPTGWPRSRPVWSASGSCTGSSPPTTGWAAGRDPDTGWDA